MFFFDIRKISVWEVLCLFLVGNVTKNVLFLPFFRYQVDDCKHGSKYLNKIFYSLGINPVLVPQTIIVVTFTHQESKHMHSHTQLCSVSIQSA